MSSYTYEVYCLMTDGVTVERFGDIILAVDFFTQMVPVQRDIAENCIAVVLYDIDEHGNYLVEREWRSGDEING
jgi:hypothetical protein